MTDVDTPAKTDDKPSDSLAKTSQDITDEALQRVAQDIKEDLTKTLETKEIPTSIAHNTRSWLREQFNKLSQAVIALIAASAVAVLTPFLVKLEVTDAVEGVQSRFQTVLSSVESEYSQQQAQAFSEINSSLNEKVTSLQTQLSDIADATPVVQQRFDALNEELSNLTKSHAALQSQITNRESIPVKPAPPQYGVGKNALSRQLSRYIKQGTALHQQENPDPDTTRKWVGEVHYFIHLIPAQESSLEKLKENLALIHQGSKPFETDKKRREETLLILNALQNWLQL